MRKTYIPLSSWRIIAASRHNPFSIKDLATYVQILIFGYTQLTHHTLPTTSRSNMFPTLPINNINTSFTAATTHSDVSDMSISSSTCMFCLKTDSLTPSPKPTVQTFTIDPASLVASPIDITNKENTAPPKIQITLEEFNTLHARPIPQVTTEQISNHPSLVLYVSPPCLPFTFLVSTLLLIGHRIQPP
jgi:hypothetical protein